MFALPEELGYDYTTRRVLAHAKGLSDAYEEATLVQYDIAVRDHDTALVSRYYTERVSSNAKMYPPRGSGTRLWQVWKLGKDGKPMGPSRVLKGCWIDSCRNLGIGTDRGIQEAIQRRLLDRRVSW